MKKTIIIVCLLCIICGLVSAADEYVPSIDKFKACENKAGAGLFWVDTTSGRTWWADPGKMKWVFFGQPKGAKPGPTGTYIPYENKSGEGVFILNTASGQGWWTNGQEWKNLGVPVK